MVPLRPPNRCVTITSKTVAESAQKLHQYLFCSCITAMVFPETPSPARDLSCGPLRWEKLYIMVTAAQARPLPLSLSSYPKTTRNPTPIHCVISNPNIAIRTPYFIPYRHVSESAQGARYCTPGPETKGTAKTTCDSADIPLFMSLASDLFFRLCFGRTVWQCLLRENHLWSLAALRSCFYALTFTYPGLPHPKCGDSSETEWEGLSRSPILLVSVSDFKRICVVASVDSFNIAITQVVKRYKGLALIQRSQWCY